MQLRQIFVVTMKKAQLFFLSVLATTIFLCYRLYSLYSTKEKNTGYGFGKFL